MQGPAYVLSDDKSKREIAKDASAFANSIGGFIFLGIKTQPSTTHFGDEIVSLSPFAQGLVNMTQYTDVLMNWVYPPISGLTVKWVPIAGHYDKGIVIIDIPPQAHSTKPFLIAKTLDGSKIVETVFGYVARKGETNPPLGLKELQHYLRAGLSYDALIDGRLSAIEADLKAVLNSPSQAAHATTLATQLAVAIETAVKHGDLAQRRSFVLFAQPNGTNKLGSVFSSNKNSIKKKVEQPPTLRHNGWSVESSEAAKIIQGKYIRVTNGDRKVLDLYEDGTMAFAVSAANDFLAWGRRAEFNINPLAFIEVVYSFAALYELVIKDFLEPPLEIRLGAQLRHTHLDGKIATLGPHGLHSLAQQFGLDAKDAPEDNFEGSYVEKAAAFDPEIVAYEIVRMVYLWFGLGEESIPYTYQKGDRTAVNSREIASL